MPTIAEFGIVKEPLLDISYLFVNLGIKVKIECLKKRRSDFDTNLRETHRINCMS